MKEKKKCKLKWLLARQTGLHYGAAWPHRPKSGSEMTARDADASRMLLCILSPSKSPRTKKSNVSLQQVILVEMIKCSGQCTM